MSPGPFLGAYGSNISQFNTLKILQTLQDRQLRPRRWNISVKPIALVRSPFQSETFTFPLAPDLRNNLLRVRF